MRHRGLNVALVIRARAPGKVVLSGAYSVLYGAPAVVSAVDRYVVADATLGAAHVTPEVREALGAAGAPWFDATLLRAEGRKLGLGSSATILVASLGAVELSRRGRLSDAALAEAVLGPALEAHGRAQPGGSGMDVLASVLGKTRVVVLRTGGLESREAPVPRGLELRVWASPTPASTHELVGRVRELERRDPGRHRELIGAQARAAESAARAFDVGEVRQFIDALEEQLQALGSLGHAVGAPIVTPEVQELALRAADEGAAVVPSGSGGGDIVLFAGVAPPSSQLLGQVMQAGHEPLGVAFGARGIHAEDG